MRCPWCEEEPLTEEDRAVHTLKAHPEKLAPNAEQFRDALEVAFGGVTSTNQFIDMVKVAATLTSDYCNNRGKPLNQDEVWDSFMDFYGKLMQELLIMRKMMAGVRTDPAPG